MNRLARSIRPRVRDREHREVEVGSLVDAHLAGSDRVEARAEVGVLVLPQGAPHVGVVERLGEAREHLVVDAAADDRVRPVEHRRIEHGAVGVLERRDRDRETRRVARVEGAEVAGASDVDHQLAAGDRLGRVDERVQPCEPVLVEVVVRRGGHAVEQRTATERPERDLRREVVAQFGRRRRPGPVRQRQHGRRGRRAVDHDVRLVGEGVVGDEPQRQHERERRSVGRYVQALTFGNKLRA